MDRGGWLFLGDWWRFEGSLSKTPDSLFGDRKQEGLKDPSKRSPFPHKFPGLDRKFDLPAILLDLVVRVVRSFAPIKPYFAVF